jgi:small-conductance mechanosensitive channel
MKTTHRTTKPIDDFEGWLANFGQPTILLELALLGVCVVLAWAVTAGLRRALGLQGQTTIMLGRKNIDGVLFPLVLLCLAYLALHVLDNYVAVVLFKLAVPVLMSLLAIRVGVKVLKAAFPDVGWVRVLERTISWVVWLLMVLWVSGLLPVMLNELEQVTWKMGSSTLSARTLLEGLLTAGVVLIITLWISAAIESRLLHAATGSELSVRKAVSNATRALLMFVGLILALSAVGIDLTALSVLGGAVGVGIGFGLQKLAANYVSGFVILAERSMRIGDIVRVDNFEGAITQINARYTVVRSITGRESIVPNEMLINSRVENHSLADPNVYQTTVVTLPYDCDVDLVGRLLLDAAKSQPRVLREPEPSVFLSAFGPDGLEFTVGYWFSDPQNSQLKLRSAVNMAILTALRANNIDIPYPQRVVHTR